jgi:hypothetical protein
MGSKIILAIKAPISIEQAQPDVMGACDRHGRCYWGRFRKGTWRWRYEKAPGPGFTHWLPASTTALPARIPFSS